MQVNMNTINLLFSTKTCLPYTCENVGVRQGEVVFDNVTGLQFPYNFVKIFYTQVANFLRIHIWWTKPGTYVNILIANYIL